MPEHELLDLRPLLKGGREHQLICSWTVSSQDVQCAECSRPPLDLESHHVEASAPRAWLFRRVSSGFLSLQRVFGASARRSTTKLYALKWKFHFMVRRSPAPGILKVWRRGHLVPNASRLGMGIVYILSIPILLINTGTYQYCYRYYLVQKDMWKIVENLKLFYYCWTLATVLKFFSQEQSTWAELSGENSRSPLTWVFAPPAPPLKVTPDRSAQFRSPLTYNFIPLRWNRSTLAHI